MNIDVDPWRTFGSKKADGYHAITLVGYDGDGVRVGLNHLRHLVVLFL